jgi:Peptidase family M23
MTHSSLPRRASTALVVALMCAATSTTRAQAPSPLAVAGQGELKTVSPAAGEHMTLAIRMVNGTTFPVRVTRAEALLACQGGWSYSLGETISQRKGLFDNSPTFGPGIRQHEFFFDHSTPIAHYLLALQLRWQGRPPRDYLLQVPFARREFEPPQPLRVAAPVFIALQEPVEVLTLTKGEVWLPIVGQLVNTSGRPTTLKRWRMGVKDGAGKSVLDRDLTANYRIEASKESLNPFFFAFDLPSEFRKGTLQIDAEVDFGDRRVTLARPADVERVEPHAVKSPVDGRWIWKRGQGEIEFHSHYQNPEQRYCYDLYVLGGDKHQTFSGDPNKNESHFAWDKPIRCIEDGKVTAVIDDVPDNFGQSPNPANNPRRNSSIVVEHAGGNFSLYSHVRKGGAATKVGQSVKAGDVLGRVGNAGYSSEPHLHVGYFVIDRSGRLRNVPIRVEGLKTADGIPADREVPKSGFEYVAGAVK